MDPVWYNEILNKQDTGKVLIIFPYFLLILIVIYQLSLLSECITNYPLGFKQLLDCEMSAASQLYRSWERHGKLAKDDDNDMVLRKCPKQDGCSNKCNFPALSITNNNLEYNLVVSQSDYRQRLFISVISYVKQYQRL